jgi:MFS family permease
LDLRWRGVGAGLSPPLITYIALHYGWRSTFWVCAAIGLIAGVVWYIVARDTPGGASSRLAGGTGVDTCWSYRGCPRLGPPTVMDKAAPSPGEGCWLARRCWRSRSATSALVTSPGSFSVGSTFTWHRSVDWISKPALFTACCHFWRWRSAVRRAGRSATG